MGYVDVTGPVRLNMRQMVFTSAKGYFYVYAGLLLKHLNQLFSRIPEGATTQNS